jgi:peptide deformylase
MEIKKYPEDQNILQTECEEIPVEEIPDYQDLIDGMMKCVTERNALGLAAPQVGVTKRTTVINPSQSDPFALINPEITHRQGEIESEEGCLSFPGITVSLKRAAAVKYC